MAGKRPAPLGALIDGIWALREQKRKLNADLEKLEESIAEQESAVIARLDQEGVDKATGRKASVSVSSNQQFNVVDWEATCEYARKNNFMHIFQRRVTADAVRELFEKKGNVPGLEPFTKRKLNIRTLS